MNEPILKNNISNEIEYIIDNNLFFENIPLHTCPILKTQYVKYFKVKNRLALNDLVDNSINRYIDDLKELKRLYVLDKNANLLFSEKRYKNYISKELLEKIKYKFMNSKLYYLDYIVTSIKNPYLDYFYLFINSINNSLYIKENQFNNSSTQYNYDNYENKTNRMKEDAENLFDENILTDSKLHKNLIDTYKENKIEGSMIISSITNSMLIKIIEILEIEELDEKDRSTLNRNQQFNKRFVHVNFTEKEMYDGFAQACFYNYAQARMEQFKLLRKEYNQKRTTTTIPNLKKDFITREIIELFNLALEKEQIINIRQSKKSPNILKVYDGIYIYTTKNLSKLEDDFYNFFIDNFIEETPKIKDFIHEHKEEMKNFISQLRIQFY